MKSNQLPSPSSANCVEPATLHAPVMNAVGRTPITSMRMGMSSFLSRFGLISED